MASMRLHAPSVKGGRRLDSPARPTIPLAEEVRAMMEEAEDARARAEEAQAVVDALRAMLGSVRPANQVGPSLPPAGVPANALWLSPLGSRIVAFLAGKGRAWTTAKEVADACDEQCSHRFKAIMTDLADRDILEASSGSGYRMRQVPKTGGD